MNDSHLLMTPQGLGLIIEDDKPLIIHFSMDALSLRREGKTPGLIRACKPKLGLKILDVTAGWGRDAALLASFGAEVIMVERQPLMQALLEDALTRMQMPWKISLIKADAIFYLKQLSPADYPDVIFIDPMHPVRQKTALVKKNMQVLQQLIGPDEDVLLLLQAAIPRARQRVVLKWPQKIPPIMPPNHSIQGKTIRYDVFLPNPH